MERCEKLKGQLFDSEEKSKMKTSIIQELSTNNSLVQSQLEIERNKEEKQHKIFQLEDQNLELKKLLEENSERYEEMLTESTHYKREIRELKNKLKLIQSDLNEASDNKTTISQKLLEQDKLTDSLKEKLSHANENLLSLEKSLELSKQQISKNEQELQNSENKINQLNNHYLFVIQGKDKIISELELKENKQSSKIKTLKEKINTLQQDLGEERQNCSDLQRKLQNALQLENESSNNSFKLNKKISTLESQLETKDQIIENLEVHLEKEKRKNQDHLENLKKKEHTLKELTQETVRLSERLLGRSKEILEYSDPETPKKEFTKDIESDDDDYV